MGWWTQNEQGESFERVPYGEEEMWWGDGPADVIDAALAAVVVDFHRGLGRAPTVAELEAGLKFSLGKGVPEPVLPS